MTDAAPPPPPPPDPLPPPQPPPQPVPPASQSPPPPPSSPPPSSLPPPGPSQPAAPPAAAALADAARPSGPLPKQNASLVWVLILSAAGFCLLTLLCLGLIAAIALPMVFKMHRGANETAARTNLQQVWNAQAQYAKQTDCYAGSAKVLQQAGLLDPTIAGAFETYAGNRDGAAQPEQGYVFRMLQGNDANVTAFVDGYDAKGRRQLSSWAATARPSQPGSTGDHQFYITEAGVIYAKQGAKDAQFLLTAAPSNDANDDWIAQP
ncbi:MAG: DUF2950 family protein [Planctomycetota bacterium]